MSKRRAILILVGALVGTLALTGAQASYQQVFLPSGGIDPIDVASFTDAWTPSAAANRLAVVNNDSDDLTIIDFRGGEDHFRTYPVDEQPSAVAYNPATRKIYVSHYGYENLGDKVYVFDADDETVDAIITLPEGKTQDIAVNSVTNKIYVTHEQAGQVSIIDGSTNSFSTTVTVGALPLGVGVNETTGRAYVSNLGNASVASSISVIGSTDTVIATINDNTDPDPNTDHLKIKGPWGIDVDESTNRIFVVTNVDGRLVEIDGSTNTPTGYYSVGLGAQALRIDDDRRLAWATQYQGVVHGFNIDTGEKVATINLLPSVLRRTGLMGITTDAVGNVFIANASPNKGWDQQVYRNAKCAAELTADSAFCALGLIPPLLGVQNGGDSADPGGIWRLIEY